MPKLANIISIILLSFALGVVVGFILPVKRTALTEPETQRIDSKNIKGPIFTKQKSKSEDDDESVQGTKSGSELLAEIERLARAAPSLRNDAMLSELWKRLGATMGHGALVAAEKQGVDRRRSVMNALLGWASVAPREAWEYAFRNPDRLGRPAAVALISAVLRSGDFSLIAELVPKVEDPGLRTSLAAMSAIQLARYSPDDADTLLRQLDNRSLGYALGAIAADWGESDPASTMNWLFAQKDVPVDNAITQVVGSWVENVGLEAVRAWLLGQPASESRYAAARAYLATPQSTRNGPDFSLLSGLSARDRDLVANMAVAKNLGHDNEVAFKWALALQNSHERQSAIARIAGVVTQGDALKLVQAIRSNGSMDEKTKSDLIQLLGRKGG